MEVLIWIGILVAVLHSATFSGLNLAVFSLSPLQLEAMAAAGDTQASGLRDMRRDSNFLLTTILWGNVATNVLLTLLSDSVMVGVVAFLFSTFVITFFGEIIPQAYFSRHALRMASRLRPVLRFWQLVLYPLAKPSALMLDAWLGKEGFFFLSEDQLRQGLKRYVASPTTDISRVEGIGALNFLALDDLQVRDKGEELAPASIVELPVEDGLVVFPPIARSADDPFLRRIQGSGHKWVVITTPGGTPELALDADGFLREALFGEDPLEPRRFCHRPILVTDPAATLHDLLPRFRVHRERTGDDVVDDDVILLWSAEQRRIITGSDILGRLLRGIARPTGLSGVARGSARAPGPAAPPRSSP